MTEQQKQTLAELRAAGYAVITFSPGELCGATPTDIEAQLVKDGNELLDRIYGGGERD